MSFSLWGHDWKIDGPWGAPGGGTFQPTNVFPLPNALVLQMSQSSAGSSDAEVISVEKFGYGTFEYTACVYPVQSGQVASGFLYVNNSQTEIDVEQTGDKPDSVWLTNYSGEAHKQFSQVTSYPQGRFHTFKFTWKPGEILYYADGNLVATHVQDVPSAPAYFLFNLWGTNSTTWGGLMTPGTRFMIVTHFSYRPL